VKKNLLLNTVQDIRFIGLVMAEVQIKFYETIEHHFTENEIIGVIEKLSTWNPGIAGNAADESYHALLLKISSLQNLALTMKDPERASNVKSELDQQYKISKEEYEKLFFKSQLDALFNETESYLAYLQNVIKNKLKAAHPRIYGNVKYVNYDGILNASEGLVADLKKENFSFNLAVQKYGMVSKMFDILSEGKKNENLTNDSINQCITNFKKAFKESKPLLTQSRDSRSIRFLKAIAVILSFGLAQKFGIWRVRGSEYTDKINNILPDTISIDTNKGCKKK
jgi:hypothetical protein